MNASVLRIWTSALTPLLCATVFGCGDAGNRTDDSAQSSSALAGPTTDTAPHDVQLKHAVDLASGDTVTVNNRSVSYSSVTNGLTTPPIAKVPGLPQSPDGRSQPVGRQLAAPGRNQASPTDCVVDFTDPVMLQISGATLWADRIHMPWYQGCDGDGYVYLRATVHGHFHLSFADPQVGFCFTHPQAYPSRIDPDGTCHYVDIKTEPRTFVTAHESNERFVLRTQRPDGKTWAAFDLNRFRVVGTKPVRLCYKTKASASGPWLSADPDSSVPGSSFCWNELGQGLWDLSGWAFDLTEVTIESSPASPGSIQIDDFHIAIHY